MKAELYLKSEGTIFYYAVPLVLRRSRRIIEAITGYCFNNLTQKSAEIAVLHHFAYPELRLNKLNKLNSLKQF